MTLIAVVDDDRGIRVIVTIRTDGVVDAVAMIRVPSLQIVKPMLVLGRLHELALIKVLSHLPHRHPVGETATQAKFDAADAIIIIGDNTKLQMIDPATNTGDSS